MPAGSQELIRDMNYHKILETVIREGSISRADLAKQLGLTKATISSQVQTLLDERLIFETGSQETSKGRRPIMLSFRGDCGYVLSFDIGLTTINLLISDLLGRHCYSRQYPPVKDGSSLLSFLTETITTLISHPGRNMDDSFFPLPQRAENEPPEKKYPPIAGICLAIHGAVWKNEVLFTPYYNLEHIPLKAELEQRFGIPVFLENEANLSALGEKTFSSGVPNLVNISVHSGLGLGFILDGRLYTGAGGFAGEFGHTIVEPNGRPCPCGNQGCIEQYASEAAVLRKYNQLRNTKDQGIDELVRDYQNKEGAARFAVQDFIRYMAIGINNIVSTINPQLIVINSTFTSYLPDVIPQIKKLLNNRMSQQCEIVPSLLQDSATLLGGVYLCSRAFLGIEDFCPPVGSNSNTGHV